MPEGRQHTVVLSKDGHRFEVFSSGSQSIRMECTAAGQRLAVLFWLTEDEALRLGHGLIAALPTRVPGEG